MSKKLIKELNISEQFDLICVNDNIYNLNIQDQESQNSSKIEENPKNIIETPTDYTKLPEIQDIAIDGVSQDDLITKLNKYLDSTKEIFEKNEILPDKTDLDEFINKKREDKTIVGFNKIKYDKINDQIQALQPNYTLEVLKDTFNEFIEVKEPVHIIANPSAIVNCKTKNDALTCSSCNVVFENFTFSYQGQDGFSALKVTDGNATFINCRFSSTASSSVIVQNSSRATFINCQFTSSPQNNILVEGNALVNLTNCKISGADKFGIELSGKSAANVRQCEINRSKNGVSISSKASALFEKCKINTNSNNAFQIKSKSKNIILQFNEISQHPNDCAIVIDNSNVKLISNTIKDNQTAISAINCSTVLTDNNIISKLDSPSEYGLVSIGKSSKFDSKDDVYEGSVRHAIEIGGKDSTFVGNNITIKNSFQGCGFYASPESKIEIDNCHFINLGAYNIYTHPPKDKSKNAANLTIKNCDFRKTSDAHIDDSQKQVGIVLSDKVKATIDNCTFSNLQKAIVLNSSKDNISVKNCSFENMTVISIESTNSSNAVFENCSIKNTTIVPNMNASFSAKDSSDKDSIKFNNCTFQKALVNIGIHSNACVDFDGCSFAESEKPSVGIKDGGKGIFNNCNFTNNRNPGLIVSKKSTAKVENSSFFANNGNGFVCEDEGSSLTIKYCKVYDHTRHGGGTFRNHAKGVIDNCEFYNNFKSNIEVNNQATVEVYNSNIHKSLGNTGICVYNGSVLNMESTNVYDESFTALYVTSNSSASLTKCSIYNCLNGGITFVRKDDLKPNVDLSKSSLTLKECHLHHNSPYAIIYFAGKLTLEKCKFEQNSSGDIGKYEGIKDFNVDPSEHIKVRPVA